MIKGIKEVLTESKNVWQTGFMDVFYNMDTEEVIYTIMPMKELFKHFYNIEIHSSINMVYVTTLYSQYKYSEEILEKMVKQAVDKYINTDFYKDLDFVR